MGVVARALVVVLLAALLSSCAPGLVNDTGVALPASDTLVPPGLADRCPPRKTPGRFPEGGQFPEGAVAVRLCNPDALDGYDADLRADVPTDVLEEGVEEFVAALNDLDEPENTGRPGEVKHFCSADGGPLLTWWVTYPDGDAWSAEYYAAGCQEVQVDIGLPRPGGPETMSLFTDLLLTQRATRTPPPREDQPNCADDTVTPLDRPERVGLVDAVECDYRDGGLILSLDLTPAQLTRLGAEAGIEPLPANECRRHGRTYRGLTAWGDVVELFGNCFAA